MKEIKIYLRKLHLGIYDSQDNIGKIDLNSIR